MVDTPACSDAPNARLIGIEYIISPRLFEKLPDDEKRYWHSHKHEIESGSLVVSAVQMSFVQVACFLGLGAGIATSIRYGAALFCLPRMCFSCCALDLHAVSLRSPWP